MKTSTKILIIACFVGLSLLLYPSFSNFWNEFHSTSAINVYVDTISAISGVRYRELWENAKTYNEDLLHQENEYKLNDTMRERYYQTLDVTGTGIMGYVEISKIGVSLPVYHGTSDAVLQTAVGHLEWTSLPVGGESTHCVVSGHRGLPSAKLFTDLDSLREGDTFTLTILNEVLTYEVDQIRTVLPSQTEDLRIVDGKDYCTLVTCTPYGINTHRLLVRGHRIETQRAGANVISEAVVVDPLIVAPVVAFPLLMTLFMMIMLKKPEKKLVYNIETVDKLLGRTVKPKPEKQAQTAAKKPEKRRGKSKKTSASKKQVKKTNETTPESENQETERRTP